MLHSPKTQPEPVDIHTTSQEQSTQELKTQDDPLRSENEQSRKDNAENSTPKKPAVLPLSRKHLEMFAKISPPPPQYRATVRTDTVSTILEQEMEFDYDASQEEGNYVNWKVWGVMWHCLEVLDKMKESKENGKQTSHKVLFGEKSFGVHLYFSR